MHGIENASQVNRDPLPGHMFENLVVIECLRIKAEPNLSEFMSSPTASRVFATISEFFPGLEVLFPVEEKGGILREEIP
jgi:hypothetical protein